MRGRATPLAASVLAGLLGLIGLTGGLMGPAAAAPAQVPAGTATDSAAADTASRLLSITTDPPGATVFLDSAEMGLSPLVIPMAPAETARVARIMVVGGEPGRWFAPVIADSIVIPAGKDTEAIVRHYAIPAAARIASEPPGAGVYLGDSLLGTTPLFVSAPDGASLTLRAPGFGPATVMLRPGDFDVHALLRPLTAEAMLESSPLAPGSGRSNTLLYVAGGTAVAGGAIAAWLKNRADKTYGEYQQGNDPATLDRVRRYDLLSGIALGVAEISIGYLLIQLLSR